MPHRPPLLSHPAPITTAVARADLLNAAKIRRRLPQSHLSDYHCTSVFIVPDDVPGRAEGCHPRRYTTYEIASPTIHQESYRSIDEKGTETCISFDKAGNSFGYGFFWWVRTPRNGSIRISAGNKSWPLANFLGNDFAFPSTAWCPGCPLTSSNGKKGRCSYV